MELRTPTFAEKEKTKKKKQVVTRRQTGTKTDSKLSNERGDNISSSVSR